MHGPRRLAFFASALISCAAFGALLFPTLTAFAQGPPPGYPGGQTAGWIPQLNPYAYQTFDWTGLTISVTRQKFTPPGGTDNYQNTDYGGFGFVGYPIEYPYQGVGGANGLKSSGLTTAGSSTYKWQWVSPNYPGTSTVDYADFPAPPLYVLGWIDLLASFSVSQTTGPTGTATIADSRGYTETATLTQPVPASASANPHRKVLGPAAPDSATLPDPAYVKTTLSPRLTTSLSGT